MPVSTPITLAQYVKKRTGVPLGHKDSMRNMLSRSLGASSFYLFWRYWNPIWSYYLSRYVMKPSNEVLPVWCAVLVTFAVSGALHDLAVSIVKLKPVFFFTPWFSVMAVVVLISQFSQLQFSFAPWWLRALANISFVVLSYWLTSLLF